MSMKVTIKDNFPQYLVRSIAQSQVAVRNMANDVVRLSKMQVPLDTGRLQSTGRYTGGGNHYIVSYSTPYARRWHFENANFKHGRKTHYLSDPAKMVGTVAATYFRAARALR